MELHSSGRIARFGSGKRIRVRPERNLLARKEAYIKVRGPEKLPVGIEDFEEIRRENFYYVDKTGLIAELLRNWAKVNLFIRPRRFGKSLNMSMLRYFFEYGCDSHLFDDLEIASEKELCKEYMGKFPVISISLKDVSAADYKDARDMLCSIIGSEALRFQHLLESPKLSDLEKRQYTQLIYVGDVGQTGFIMTDNVLENSLITLSAILRKHYGQKVILFIDEYDVPLDKAQQFGYYESMLNLIRKIFGRSLKSNDSLHFAVLTGCLRIAKESIFTGLNNFGVSSITNAQYDEYFGFSDIDVRRLLAYYDCEEKYQSVKEWYNGYRFGNADVYCPWDVINYVNLIQSDPEAAPQAFWVNTSGNDIIRHFLHMAKSRTRKEIEDLIAGKSIVKKINQELTYRDLYKNTDHVWSVLFTTGYLTWQQKFDSGSFQLIIPNLEIRKIFIEQIEEWFQDEVRKDMPKLDAFCEAFIKEDAESIESYLNTYLQKTISIRDTSVQKEKKENFYHGILLGLLSCHEEWDICSNAESGEGFSDILVEIEEKQTGIVIEIKYSEHGNLDLSCAEALKQIEDKDYAARLKLDGMTTILKYGIACWKKRCKVKSGDTVRQSDGRVGKAMPL